MDDIAELVVTPFRDIVEKGRTAVENAGDSRPMLKAAQALVKEGERALKKIEPLCRKHLDEYGSNFLDALKENDEIATYRSDLTDLLWEFDDYLEPDDFEAEKFAELQALSRKAAPVIYGILVRMKLEVPADSDARSIMTRISAPRSPPLSPSIPPVPPLFPNSFSVVTPPPIEPPSNPPEPATNERSDPPTVEAATAQLKELMQTQSGPDVGLYGDFPAPPPRSRQRTPVEPPPRPPSANPWDVKVSPPIPESRMNDDFAFERRAPVAPTESPIEPISPPMSPETRPSFPPPPSRPRPLNTAPSDRSSQYSNDPKLSPTGLEAATYERTYNVFPSQSPRGRYSNTTSIMSSSIPEDAVSDRESQSGKFALLASRLPASYELRAPPSRPESLESNLSSVFDSNRRTDGSTTPLTNNDHRGSTVSGLQNSPTLGTSLPTPIYVKPLPVPPVRQSSREAAKIPTPPPPIPPPIYEEQYDTEAGTHTAPEVDYGPIPVDTEISEPVHAPNPFTVDCKVHPDSSFFLHKGFCEGAQDVLRGGIGVKKQKKAGFATTATIGRCINCFFELDFKEIELDVNGAERGNFTKNGIGFRLRFLQKSHISTRRTDDVLYACLFCIGAGRTLHASDATVFTSQKALFAHLARHPRPLPSVPGVTVIQTETIPAQFRNNYDLHIKSPREDHPVIERVSEIALLPTGTSRDAARRMYGQRLLHDKTPALEMVQGARIVGLHWPDKYSGEWAMGWYDGNYASLPTEILKLDQPPEEEIQMWGTSQIQVTTRWKFNPKDRKGTKWLKFDREEVLSNIGWAYQDHWCWSGTTSKGTWGIFPKAFVDVATLRDSSDIMSFDRVSVLSEEKKPGMLTRLTTRRSNRSGGGRPASSAGSIGSHEMIPSTPRLY